MVFERFVRRQEMLSSIVNFNTLDPELAIYTDGPSSIAINDFNNHTLLDMGITQHEVHQIGVYLRDCRDKVHDLTAYFTGPYSSPWVVTVGHLDIAVENSDTNNVDSSRPIASIGAHRNDETTLLDLVVANQGTNDVHIFLGHGDGSFRASTVHPVGTFPMSMASVI